MPRVDPPGSSGSVPGSARDRPPMAGPDPGTLAPERFSGPSRDPAPIVGSGGGPDRQRAAARPAVAGLLPSPARGARFAAVLTAARAGPGTPTAARRGGLSSRA